jgi:hypothetical protein
MVPGVKVAEEVFYAFATAVNQTVERVGVILRSRRAAAAVVPGGKVAEEVLDALAAAINQTVERVCIIRSAGRVRTIYSPTQRQLTREIPRTRPIPLARPKPWTRPRP